MVTEQTLAREVALQRIARVREREETELSLDGLALEQLPEEIGDLVTLQSLNLTKCYQLHDLQLLAGLPDSKTST